jgi:hypothetical protein
VGTSKKPSTARTWLAKLCKDEGDAIDSAVVAESPTANQSQLMDKRWVPSRSMGGVCTQTPDESLPSERKNCHPFALRSAPQPANWRRKLSPAIP